MQLKSSSKSLSPLSEAERLLATTDCVCDDEVSLFIQHSTCDGSQRPLSTSIERLAYPGLKWESTDRLELYAPPTTAMTVSAFLASHVKLFDESRVFVEAARTSSLTPSDSSLLLVKMDNLQSYLFGDRAKSVAGSLTSETLRGLGFRCFIAATSPAQIVSPRNVVLYRTPIDCELDPLLQRIEVNPDRFVACLKKASTVGATLRANEIYYATARAVYVRVCNFTNIEAHGDKLLAFPDSKDKPRFFWSGSKITKLVKEESFRAAFNIYAPCRDPWQQLAPGMTVLLDLENLSSAPSAEEKLIIVRYYPEPGKIDTKTQTHHNNCISSSGVRVFDKGYQDDKFFKGFRRGWVGSDVYWRVVGNSPNCFLSGGTVDDPYKFNIHKEHDVGYDKKRVMIQLPQEGFVYCRGVGDDVKNPEMACVLFGRDGKIRERYGYLGQLGRWKGIFQ